MKKKAGKMILLTGVLCILSLAVCACGKTEEAPDAEEPRMFQGEPIQEDDIKDDVSTPEPSAEWVDSTPNLEGDAKDLKDGQLTVVESVTEKSDNGGDIMVSPGSGDDSDFNKVAVTYDENTLFAIQTIYDGGARAEMSAATAADLASGQHIQVWGSPSGSGLKATRICIVKVA